ncbi:MAG: histidinol-phosphate transaminase [Deltaproteobacteria bacterium]|jgi:histidinol-phosphate aminotransferase|nr:histidinol-phosphate transaminase [Deltaproteobacteria bacterium]
MKSFNVKAPDYIYKINPYIPGKPIEEVEREKGIKNIVKLASNENPLGPSPLALKAIKSYLKNLNRYPDGSGFYLKQELVKIFNLKSENFILGNGSNELIDIAARTFCERDENIVSPFPSFVAYYLAGEQLGLKLKISRLKEDYSLDLDDIYKLIDDKTKIVFISNPNNPTGTFFSNDKIINFIKKVNDGVLIIVDEAYIEYIGKSLIEDIDIADFPNVLVLRTFSKVYGLAGLRVGYGIGNKDLISLMDRTREPFNVNSLSLAAAAAALEDKEYLEKVIETNETEKNYLYGGFKKMGLEFIKTGANFILVKLKGQKAAKISEKLLDGGVIVRPMDRFGYDDMIRITIGTHKENVKLIKALRRLT